MSTQHILPSSSEALAPQRVQFHGYRPGPLPATRPQRLLFIFLDGVGIGVKDLNVNPMAHLTTGLFPLFLTHSRPDPKKEPEGIEPQVFLSPNAIESTHARAQVGHHAAIDAGLDMPGIPQSATGQATLFTGINGAKLLGHHLMAFPEQKLTRMVKEHNLLLKAKRLGKRAAFLNTYTPRFHELGYPHSVSTICALSLDQPLLMLDEMRAGRSLFHDITQEGLHMIYGDEIPVFDPYDAGRHLAGAATHQEVGLYEHFWTDRIGHKADLMRGIAQMQKVERFLEGVLDHSALDEVLVVVCTDHGNMEDARTKGHTRNPVALSAWGPGAAWLCQAAQGLEDVTPLLMRLLFDAAEAPPAPQTSPPAA